MIEIKRPKNWRRIAEALTKAQAVAVTEATRETAKNTQDIMRYQMQATGLGVRVSNALRLADYPSRGSRQHSLSPKGVLYSANQSAANIHAAFDRGMTIMAKNKRFLAIPLPTVPEEYFRARRRYRGSVPWSIIDNWPAKWGRLVFVKPPGKRFGMLVATGVRAAQVGNGGYRISAVRSRKRKDGSEVSSLKGVAQVPMFILRPVVKMPKKTDADGILGAQQAIMPRRIADQLAKAMAKDPVLKKGLEPE